jgi:CheY-like chemotaxis protein
MESDAEKYIEAGFDDYIPKPVTKDIIERKIANFYSNEDQSDSNTLLD